ncbi:hypothetical protein [Aquariibacter albus]|uniref:Uncharacterized protein n=1 Tax=Aquariibacter albus TaxID=2759899 RepID=A0A839HK15_9BURK|nr:hypothetical protein [Aquariibacter albus]MBB1163127.1 hypothetical protein [Aquariibacter albus]
MKQQDIDYICKQMLHIDWSPRLDAKALEVLARCDSKLEAMFILGACDFIRQRCPVVPQLSTSSVRVSERIYEGIWLWEPWFAWDLDDLPEDKRGGPSALLFVPQFESSEKKITHDLALFYGDDNGSPRWSLKHVVEIDGYGVHKGRREKDESRDVGLSYRVNRFYEETDKPLDWFKTIVHQDAESGVA